VSSRLRITEATLDVLEALLGPDDQLYGLKIAKAIDRATGSVFPILARLEQFGWVISEWETTDPQVRGPRRRFYRLSPDGLSQARATLAERRPTRKLAGAGPLPRLAPRPGSTS
jgi:DNA-binding PadR family transcriptional regulator